MYKNVRRVHGFQRVAIGIGTLFVLLATVYYTQEAKAATPQTEQVLMFIPPIEPPLVHASVVNDSDQVVRVRIAHEGTTEDLVHEQPIGPTGMIPFAAEADRCHLPLLVWVNGYPSHRLDGDLCSEPEPDYGITIYIRSPQEVGIDSSEYQD